MTPSFWQGKKVLITGLTGFKGSWLGLMLKSFGARVTGLSLPAEQDSLFAQLNLNEEFQSLHQDIDDPRATQLSIDNTEPDILFHLAAQSLVRESYRSPAQTFMTNVQGTVHVLESLRLNSKICTAVIVTSDKCYENLETSRPYTEDDRLGGHDPYSASKGACEIVTNSYIRSFFRKSGQAVATARAGNVIGGGDFAKDRIVPDCIRAFVRGEQLEIRSPRAVRPWQHVLEPLSGYIRLAEHLALAPKGGFDTAWNFGPNEDLTTSVDELVKNLVRLWGGDARYQIADDTTLHEAQLLRLNCAKARETLGWHPVLSFEETLAWSVDWYKTHARSKNTLFDLTLSQIENYKKRRVNL